MLESFHLLKLRSAAGTCGPCKVVKSLAGVTTGSSLITVIITGHGWTHFKFQTWQPPLCCVPSPSSPNPHLQDPRHRVLPPTRGRVPPHLWPHRTPGQRWLRHHYIITFLPQTFMTLTPPSLWPSSLSVQTAPPPSIVGWKAYFERDTKIGEL